MPPRTHVTFTAGRALFLLDVVFVAIAWPIGATAVLHGTPAEDQPGPLILLLLPIAYMLFLYAIGLYRRDAILETRRSLGRVPLAAGLAALIAWAITACLPSLLGSAGSPALMPAAIVAFALAGFGARIVFFALRRHRAFRRHLLIVGAGRRAWDLVWLLRKESSTLTYDIAFVHDPSMGEIDARLAEHSADRIFPASEGFLEIARKFGADQIVVAPDERRGMAVEALLACKTAGFPVTEYIRFLEKEIRRIDLKRLELSWMLYSEGFTFGLIDRALKRTLDIAVSGTLLLITLPFLLVTAIAIKLDDGGPILYRQARVTRHGRIFNIMKVRTMRLDAERDGAVWAAERDPRITRIGTFLRRTRIDELPQLINILKSDMSFVGPRPERPEFTEKLAARLPLYDQRHIVKAGLTGWAQVNYPYGSSLNDARSKLSYDLYYVKNFSILLDLLIILQTVRVVLWPVPEQRAPQEDPQLLH